MSLIIYECLQIIKMKFKSGKFLRKELTSYPLFGRLIGFENIPYL